MTSFGSRVPAFTSVLVILHAYTRRQELIRLCRWAARKRLSRPLRLYRSRLQDEEVRLSSYVLRDPRSARWARSIHLMRILLFGEPRFIRRGTGAYYRRGQVASPTPANEQLLRAEQRKRSRQSDPAAKAAGAHQ